MLLVFVVNQAAQGYLDLAGGLFFAVGGGESGGEEELERIDAVVGLHVFAVDGARHGGDVDAHALRHVVEYHGAELVAVGKEVALHVYDGLHHGHEGFVAALQGVDETLGGVHLLASVYVGVALLARQAVALGLILLDGLLKGAAHVERGHVVFIQPDVKAALAVGVYRKVGHYLLGLVGAALVEREARPRVEVYQYVENMLEVVGAHAQAVSNVVPALAFEVVKHCVYHAQGFLAPGLILDFGVSQLQVQAFLKVAGTDAARVKRL